MTCLASAQRNNRNTFGEVFHVSAPIFYHHVRTSLGPMAIGFLGREIRFAHFCDSEYESVSLLKSLCPDRNILPATIQHEPLISSLEHSLLRMTNGEPPIYQPPTSLLGTSFQRAVWSCLRNIPLGEVRTYQEIAQAIGAPRAVRAVASACARNQIALWIPCHRVVRADGTLGGYRWGIERKRALLEAERARRLSPTTALT